MKRSGVVFAEIPGRGESHVVAGLDSDPPNLITGLRGRGDQSEGQAEALHLERRDLDAVEGHLAEFLEPLPIDLLRGARQAEAVVGEGIDLRCTETATRVEKVEGD